MVSSLIFNHFPEDQIVGEEDSTELNTPENAETKAQIVRLANEAMKETISDGEAEWAGVKKDSRGEKEWLAIIDRGNSTGGKSGSAFNVPFFRQGKSFGQLTAFNAQDIGHSILLMAQRVSCEEDNTLSASD